MQPDRQLARLRRERRPDRRSARGREQDGRRAECDQPLDAEGDRRDRGSALLPARRRRPDGDPPRLRRRRHRGAHRPGRLDDHAGARAQPLPLARADAAAEGRRGVPGGQARAHLVEGQDPHGVPERRLLRQPRVRDRGCGRDVLLRSGEPADARAGRAARGAAAGAVLLRPAPRSGWRARRAGTRCCSALRRSGDITDAQYAAAARDRSLHLRPSPAYASREPYFVGYVEDLPAAGVRRGDRSRGRAEDLHDDPATPAARCSARPVGGAARPARPRRRDRLDRSRERRDSRDGGRNARNAGQRVQPRDDGRAPGGLDVQADRPRRRGRATG